MTSTFAERIFHWIYVNLEHEGFMYETCVVSKQGPQLIKTVQETKPQYGFSKACYIAWNAFRLAFLVRWRIILTMRDTAITT